MAYHATVGQVITFKYMTMHNVALAASSSAWDACESGEISEISGFTAGGGEPDSSLQNLYRVTATRSGVLYVVCQPHCRYGQKVRIEVAAPSPPTAPPPPPVTNLPIDWAAIHRGAAPTHVSVALDSTATFSWTGYHNVYRVANQSAFDGCDTAGGQLESPSANGGSWTSPAFELAGTHYFICSVASHCAISGQKVAITVQPRMEVSTPPSPVAPPLSSPPPSPSPPSHPSITGLEVRSASDRSGAIVGGSVGGTLGVCFLCLLVAGGIVRMRRRATGSEGALQSKVVDGRRSEPKKMEGLHMTAVSVSVLPEPTVT